MIGTTKASRRRLVKCPAMQDLLVINELIWRLNLSGSYSERSELHVTRTTKALRHHLEKQLRRSINNGDAIAPIRAENSDDELLQ